MNYHSVANPGPEWERLQILLQPVGRRLDFVLLMLARINRKLTR
ncbi:hypothetical protein [Brucella intermedia]